MRRGERARVWAAPVHGYGPAGSFSFPTVPPDSHLAYDLELLDWEPPEEGRPARAMLFEERLEAAARRRADGNAAFAAGRLAEALERYALALSYVDEELMIQLEGFHHEKATAERSAALLNAAAAHLRLGDAAAAAATAGAALAGDPGNAKALFRRGAARRALGQTAAAVEDLAAAARGAPGDAGVARELAAARAAARAERAAGDALFRGVVARGEARQPSGGEAVAPAPTHTAVGWAAAALRAVCPCAFRRRKAHIE
jgi:tetratricopeptide (TPR) repeat protein